MSIIIGDLLSIHQTELRFPTAELGKQSSCTLQVSNKTDESVIFKVMATNPTNIFVCPNPGIISPGYACEVTEEQCEDMFLIQRAIAPEGATWYNIKPEMFYQDVKAVDEIILRGIRVPAKRSSPWPWALGKDSTSGQDSTPEIVNILSSKKRNEKVGTKFGSEEGASSKAFGVDDGNQKTYLLDDIPRSGLRRRSLIPL